MPKFLLLNRALLDVAQCEAPNCTHEDHSEIYLYANCHITGGLTVSYHRKTGSLHITCNTCGGFIADIAVAP